MDPRNRLSIEKADKKSVDLVFLKYLQILYRNLLVNIFLEIYIYVYIFLEMFSNLQYFPRAIFTLF